MPGHGSHSSSEGMTCKIVLKNRNHHDCAKPFPISLLKIKFLDVLRTDNISVRVLSDNVYCNAEDSSRHFCKLSVLH